MANGLTDIRKFLDPLRLPDEVKAKVWDEFYGSQMPEEAKQRLDSLEIPEGVKGGLWDVKFHPSLSSTELMQRARETSPAAGFAWKPEELAEGLRSLQEELTGTAPKAVSLTTIPKPGRTMFEPGQLAAQVKERTVDPTLGILRSITEAGEAVTTPIEPPVRPDQGDLALRSLLRGEETLGRVGRVGKGVLSTAFAPVSIPFGLANPELEPVLRVLSEIATEVAAGNETIARTALEKLAATFPALAPKLAPILQGTVPLRENPVFKALIEEITPLAAFGLAGRAMGRPARPTITEPITGAPMSLPFRGAGEGARPPAMLEEIARQQPTPPPQVQAPALLTELLEQPTETARPGVIAPTQEPVRIAAPLPLQPDRKSV